MLMYPPMKTLRESVKAEIQKAMKEEEVSNAELARRMKCSPVTSLLMVQQTRNLQLDTVEKLAKALGRRVEIALVVNGKKAGK